MNIQTICREGQPEYAVVPYSEYTALLEKAEALDDVAAFDRSVHELETGQDELVPAAVVEQLVAGEPPIKVWRKHRGMTQAALAAGTGLSQSHVAMLERGNRATTTDKLARLARALEVDPDDLIADT